MPKTYIYKHKNCNAICSAFKILQLLHLNYKLNGEIAYLNFRGNSVKLAHSHSLPCWLLCSPSAAMTARSTPSRKIKMPLTSQIIYFSIIREEHLCSINFSDDFKENLVLFRNSTFDLMYIFFRYP